MRKLIIVIACYLLNNQCFSQSSTDSVRLVINKMFTAMKTGDTVLLKQCFSEGAVLQTVAKNKEGQVSVKSDEISAFVKQIAKLPKGDADERIRFETVKVDADLAIAWTPYQFYYKGNFSHCGVNSFQLVRINGQWKIQYIIDTRRKDNCI